jgi:cellulose synthase/poly-beta-1,6-N-acetylglucosamine synthase-like glycosyltransferase
MNMRYTIFLAIGSIAVAGAIFLISIFFYGFITNKALKLKGTNQEVAVIVPCKGFDKHLEKNLQALTVQSYPKYAIIFVVDSKKDTAYPIINKIVKKTQNARLTFSETIRGTSGKISALITAIKTAKKADIYVFADSDIRPHKNWLTYLVAYLSDKNVGATTGFRWFFPYNLKTSLVSVWNMASMISLFHPISNYTWGGSTAITKTLFDTLGIETKWKTGYSDDLILSDTIKKAGYQIKFVPQCIVESPAETNITAFLYWATQQFTWIRWYKPSIWFFSFFGMIILQILIVLGCILILTGWILPGLLMLSMVFFEMLYGLIELLVLKELMCYPRKKFGSTIPYVLLMPLVFLLYTYNLLLSSVKQEITWGGKKYRKSDALKR